MRVLRKYLRPYRSLMFLSLLLAGAAQILALIDPVIFGTIIDRSAAGVADDPEASREVFSLLLIAVGVSVLALLAKAAQEYVTRMLVQRFGMDIFNDGLAQTLRLSYQEFADERSGETLSVLQNVRAHTERLVETLIDVLFASIVGLGFLVWYALTKHWALVPIFLIGVLVLGGTTVLLSYKIRTVQRALNRETRLLSGVITESLRNIELVKSLGLTFPEIRRLKAQVFKIFTLEMFKAKRVRTLAFLQGTGLVMLRQAILFSLLWLIFRGLLTTGELISMQAISVALFSPLREIGRIILVYREAEASLRNFELLMNKPIERRPESPVDIGPIERLRFENVVFRHRGSTENSLDGVSFEAKLGDTIAFVGPSGSGKSTLVKLLVGLYVPVSGGIHYNGIPSTSIRYNEARRQLGFVTQETHLFAGSIKDNIRYVQPTATDAEIVEAMEMAACASLLNRTGKGLDTEIGEGGIKMSGGEKQRLSIARALIRKPRLLIFDEATSALDSITEEEVTQTVRKVSELHERMTILIAHRLSTVMHADVIYVLERGKIIEQGRHEELLELKGLYYAMWRQQIGERKFESRPTSDGESEVVNEWPA